LKKIQSQAFLLHNIATFILNGRLAALLITALASAAAFFAPFFALITGAVIGLITLRKGTSEAMIIVALSATPLFFLLQAELGRPAIALPLLAFLSFPIIVIALFLNKSQSQGIAITAAAVIAALFVISLRILFEDIDLFWREWLSQTVKYVKGATVSGFNREGSLQFVTGLASSSLTLCMILTILASRWLQSVVYNPGGFSKEFQSLRLSKPVAWATLTTLLLYIGLSYQEGNILSDLLMIAAIAYAFHGIATLHGATKTAELSRIWVVLAYLSLFLLPRFTIVLLAFIGLADTFFDFRCRRKIESD
jgi:hypothetical protein